MKAKFSLFPVLFLFFSLSCSKENVEQDNADIQCPESNEINTVRVVPIEDALKKLESFMYDDATKAVKRKTVGSITAYSIKQGCFTKSITGVPDVYLVNFIDDEGYAVLGANTLVDPIIAVTELGNLTLTQNDIMYDSPCLYSWENVERFLNLEEDFDVEPFDWYVEEEDDYYTWDDAGRSFEMVRFLIDDAVSGGCSTAVGQLGTTSNTPEVSITSDPSQMEASHSYTTKAPLLSTNWNQGQWRVAEKYNKYCFKGSGNSRKNVYAGCSITALAMIMAYNEFPNIIINETDTLHYKLMPLNTVAGNEEISRLFGCIFQNTDRLIACSGGTCVLPVKIAGKMSSYGYETSFYRGSSMTSEMIWAISDMLREDKPVFLSAIRVLPHAHSWVVDGAKYTSEGQYLLHCNWGWSGWSNGYFSTSCFNPSAGVEYDTSCISYDKKEYTHHFRMITYDFQRTGEYKNVCVNY